MTNEMDSCGMKRGSLSVLFPTASSCRTDDSAPVVLSMDSTKQIRRGGFTLVEMLVTTAVTLTILLALVNVFSWVGDRVASGRAMIEMSNVLRAASTRLRNDLDNMTVPVRPFPAPDSAQGYFEYIERPLNDDSGRQRAVPESLIGDTDDILAFTARSIGDPYTGQWLGYAGGGLVPRAITSQQAEIYWWAQYDDINGDLVTTPDEQVSLVLHRRALLIRPDLNQANGMMFSLPSYFNPGKNTYNGNNPSDVTLLINDLRRLYNTTNISFRLTSGGTISSFSISVVANTLADLSQRQNRWLRRPYVQVNPTTGAPIIPLPGVPQFPFPVDETGSVTSLSLVANYGDRLGEDIILSNVLAFDVRAFDPTARIVAPSGVALLPPDPGWTPALAANNANVVGQGGFVDLNYQRAYGTSWNNGANSVFSGGMNPKARLNSPNINYACYDTWSFFYEHDGIDQDGLLGTDQGTDGVDNNPTGATLGTDDPSERETLPPYPVALRGIQVMIRVIDNDTRQVRQATIVSNFIPD